MSILKISDRKLARFLLGSPVIPMTDRPRTMPCWMGGTMSEAGCSIPWVLVPDEMSQQYPLSYWRVLPVMSLDPDGNPPQNHGKTPGRQ